MKQIDTRELLAEGRKLTLTMNFAVKLLITLIGVLPFVLVGWLVYGDSVSNDEWSVRIVFFLLGVLVVELVWMWEGRSES